MTEDELVAGLQAGTLPPAEFTHRNHVRAAWRFLTREPLRAAAYRFRDVLQAYVRALGSEEKFHLTLTLAFMHVIHERLGPADEPWDAFAARCPELFDDARALISRHYSPERIAAGRRDFAEPDRQPLP